VPRNILVIGVPRSGTSLTTAVFARKGYHVGWIEDEGTRCGDERNPFGYFEADDVIGKNVALFKRVGYGEHNSWLRAMISEAHIRQIAELTPSDDDRRFVDSYQARAPWIWKDPRLCLTLSYWWKLMDPQTTGVILTQRDVADVLRSFDVMGWIGEGEQKISREKACARIERHLSAAGAAIAALHIPHIAIDYREYLNDPQAVARRLSEFCGLHVSVHDLNVKTELAHSTLWGRFLAFCRLRLNRGLSRYLGNLKRLIPTRLAQALFPEKKYVGKPGVAKNAPEGG
jgi:hypothetical protein